MYEYWNQSDETEPKGLNSLNNCIVIDNDRTFKNSSYLLADKYASNFNIIEVAKRLGLSKFVFLARKTVLYYTLRRFRFLTVFIPTNDALDKYLHTKVGRETSTNEYKLRLFLMMHIFSGRWPTVVMKDRRKLENFLPGSYGEVNILFDAKVNSLLFQEGVKTISNPSKSILVFIHEFATARQQTTTASTSQFTLFKKIRKDPPLVGYNNILLPSLFTFRHLTLIHEVHRAVTLIDILLTPKQIDSMTLIVCYFLC